MESLKYLYIQPANIFFINFPEASYALSIICRNDFFVYSLYLLYIMPPAKIEAQNH